MIEVGGSIMKCEYCGNEIEDDNKCQFELIMYYTNPEEGRCVAGEYDTNYSEYGSMCGTCSTKLMDKINLYCRQLGFRERYERDKIDKKKLRANL